MHAFDYEALCDRSWDSETLDCIAQIHEYKGRQESVVHEKTAQLERMAALAMLQSTGASSRIAGIRIGEARLKKLCAGSTQARTAGEKEILGYRNTLRTISRNYRHIPFRPEYILLLHRDLYRFSDRGGGSFGGAGGGQAAFMSSMPYETARAVEQLCDGCNRATEAQTVNALLLIPTVIRDFLCIRPFAGGNGRMSRLLTLLLLYRSGYMAAGYISLERIISEEAVAYRKAVEQSCRGWQEGEDDPAPFIKYSVRVLLAAYREFETRTHPLDEKLPALDTVRRAAAGVEGKMTKAQLMTLCPGLAKSSVEAAVKKLVETGELQKQGSGRATWYTSKN